MTELMRSALAAALILTSLTTFAQQGPEVPCADCDTRTQSPWPVSGPWVNSDRDGSGFLLETQNGTIAGWYFGYDDAGDPIWYLFTAPLIVGSEENVMWEASADLLLFDGGNCVNCPWVDPGAPEIFGTIHIEFFQKNHGRFQFDGAEPENMVHLQFDGNGARHFSEITSYFIPAMSTRENEPGRWALVFSNHNEEPSELIPALVNMQEEVMSEDGTTMTIESVEIENTTNFDDIPKLKFECGTGHTSGLLGCTVVAALESTGMTYSMPIANLGTNRFFAEDGNGNTIEGFRLDYD